MSVNKRIYLSAPHMSGNEQKYIHEAFMTNWIAPIGPNIDAFEKEFANYIGVNGAVAVSSGTAAIHLALKLLQVKEGDKVFCSSFTFVASANPILYERATPVFIDSDLDTWCMSPAALKKALVAAEKEGELPKAVIIVHLYGQSAKMMELMEICAQYHVPIIEDAAESLGTKYKGKKSGTFGSFGIFSFNGNKIITTSGGGMLVSNDLETLKKAKFLATQARDDAPFYQHSEVGYNFRMSNVLAGIGRGQLDVITERLKQKQVIFHRYVQALQGIDGVDFMPEYEGTNHNRWLTTLLLSKELGVSPLQLVASLEKENIEARLLWKPLHLQPLFRNYHYYAHSNEISVSERLFASGICLPSGTNMTAEDQQRVIRTVQTTLKKKLDVCSF